MNWFYSLKIARKLLLGFGVCLMLSVIVGGIAVSGMSQMNETAARLASGTVLRMEAIEKFSGAMRQFRTTEYRAVLTCGNAAQWQKDQDRLAELRADAEKGLQDYGLRVRQPQDKQNYTAIQADWQNYLAMHDGQLMPAITQHDVKTGTALINTTMRDPFLHLTDDLGAMADWNSGRAQELSRTAQSEYVASRNLTIILLTISVLIGIASGWFISHYVANTLAQISGRLQMLQSICVTNLDAAVQAMEHGDLTAEIATGTEPLEIQTKDEFGAMAMTFNALLENIKSTVGSFRTSQASLSALVLRLQAAAAQVAGASNTLSATSQQVGAVSEEITATMQEVATASDQSARGASEIARGGTTQAAALAQGSALVRQLSESVHNVARDSQAATQAAADATSAAQEGALTVSQSVRSMQNIRRTVSDSAQIVQTLGEASSRIGGIVQTIDEIAGQTNLLALNAAIEAARAGDAGRGFAVVADEVRKLAERSSEATREISSLIADVQSRTEQAVKSMQVGNQEVQSGQALAEQAGAALTRIQAVVQTVTERIEGIQAATAEMTAASDEVSRAITEVAAVVEESSAAAEEMSASADQVSASVQTVAGTVAQQSSAVEELVASAESLSEIAGTLEGATAQFRVSETSGTRKTAGTALHLLRAA